MDSRRYIEVISTAYHYIFIRLRGSIIIAVVLSLRSGLNIGYWWTDGILQWWGRVYTLSLFINITVNWWLSTYFDKWKADCSWFDLAQQGWTQVTDELVRYHENEDVGTFGCFHNIRHCNLYRNRTSLLWLKSLTLILAQHYNN